MSPGLVSTPVWLLCEGSCGKHDGPDVVTEHRFQRREHLTSGSRLLFRCVACAAERTFGVEA